MLPESRLAEVRERLQSATGQERTDLEAQERDCIRRVKAKAANFRQLADDLDALAAGPKPEKKPLFKKDKE